MFGKSRQKPTVTMFTRAGCPFCVRADGLLADHGLEYEEIPLGGGITMASVEAVTGRSTVPQIFIDGQHIGGYTDLVAHFEKGGG